MMRRHGYSTADVLPPQAAISTADALTSAPSQAVPEGAVGPLVCDVFVGDFPRHVPAIVRLPCVVCVPISRPAEPPAAVRAELTLHPNPHPNPRGHARGHARGPRGGAAGTAPPSRDVLVAELTELLARDRSRERALEVRGSVVRAERRLAVRTGTRVPTRTAAELHVRVAVMRPKRPHRGAPPRGRLARPVRPRVHDTRASGEPPRRATKVLRRRFHGASLAEALRVGIGALVCAGLVIVLASAGSLLPVAQSVRSTAAGGAAALRSGLRALLTADAEASISAFAAAHQKFLHAVQQLTTSTTVVQRLAASLDPAGRLPAARTLLAVGERAAALGTEAAAVIQLFGASTQTLTETLAEAAPRLRNLEGGLKEITDTLRGLSTAGWPPEDLATVATLAEALSSVHRGLATFLQSQTVVLELLGSRVDRQYLFLFENNRELRPTGGFIGSFALVDIARGAVRNVRVDTIYNPDGQLKDFLVPPVPLQKIADRWYARDANWFADFRQSASKVANLFERSGGPTVDGVLAVTPAILEDLVRLAGPIPMPAYQVTITAENVVAQTQRLVTYEYDRERNEPKAFIADLLPQVLARVLELPRERWGEIVGVLTSALDRKHLLVYFRDAAAEDAVIKLGWGGTLPVLPAATASVLTDHVGRSEANIGGHKTDLLIEQEADYDVTVSADGDLVATLVVTRHHRGPRTGTPGLAEAEDPARKTNVIYERTLVPRGSELLEARGFTPAGAVPAPSARTTDYATFERDPDLVSLEQVARDTPEGITIGDEAGFTTFGGWVITAPEQTTVTVLRYRLPLRLPRPTLVAAILRYALLLTHQPGHLPVLTRATLRVPEGFRLAWTGPSSTVTTGGERKATFAASLDRDATWGAVIEEQ